MPLSFESQNQFIFESHEFQFIFAILNSKITLHPAHNHPFYFSFSLYFRSRKCAIKKYYTTICMSYNLWLLLFIRFCILEFFVFIISSDFYVQSDLIPYASVSKNNQISLSHVIVSHPFARRHNTVLVRDTKKNLLCIFILRNIGRIFALLIHVSKTQ